MVKHLTFFIISAIGSLCYAQDSRTNALSLRNGCTIISAPPSFIKNEARSSVIKNWTPPAIIDEIDTTGWCSPRGVKAELTFIFELSEDYVIDELIFKNSTNTEYPGLNAKEVTIAFSNESAYATYKKVGDYVLKEHTTTSIPIKQRKARWIMVQIHSNYGNPEYTELMDIQAMGRYYQEKIEAKSINGSWHTNWGSVYMKENKHGLLYGCYKFNEGSIVNTSRTRRIYSFNWSEAQEEGWATLVLNKEGNAMNGIWGTNDKPNEIGFWRFTHKDPHVKPCNNEESMVDKHPDYHDGQQKLVFHLRDHITKEPISGRVKLTDEHGNSYYEEATAMGRCEFPVAKSRYEVQIINPEYFTYIDQLDVAAEAHNYDNMLEKTYDLKELELNAQIPLKNIMFRKNSHILLSESYDDLNELIELMNTHPDMKIEISGHTDNTATHHTSMLLSQNRVNSVKQYLIDHGIKKSRIKGKGYGDTRPIASNASEETRKLNRRVEFKITKF